MNFKLTVILFGVLIVLAGAVFFSHEPTPGKKNEKGPEIWSVDEEKIERIRIRLPHEGKEIAFFKDKDEKWRFDDRIKHPVDMKRWGGIVLLVSSPNSKRIIAENMENPGEYGFISPQMIIHLGVRDRDDPLEIRFGDHTPRKDRIYVSLKDGSDVYIIAEIYFSVLKRLALEPPLPPLVKARMLKEDRQGEFKKY